MCVFTAQIRNQQIDKRSSPSISTSTNTTHQSTQHNQRSSPASKDFPKSNTSEKSPDHQYHEIFKIVCDYIEDWRDFGRCLNITERDLKEIGFDQSLQNNIKLMTNRLLEQALQQFGNGFIEALCAALIEARRRDILRKLRDLKLINY